VHAGTVYPLAPDWLVDHSPAETSGPPAAPGADRGDLGFALLRVAGAPGDQPIGGERAEPYAERRGWIMELGAISAPILGYPVCVLSYTKSGALTLSAARAGFISVDESGTRLRYGVDAQATIAGAACFSPDLELIALHQGETGSVGEGTSFAAIIGHLQERGLMGILGRSVT
jgi:hypothetical protein